MGDCNKISNTCGKKINARCVDYEGTVNEQSSLEEGNCLTIHQTNEDIYNQLEEIWNEIDMDALGDACIEYTPTGEDGKLLIKDVVLGLEEKICELDALVFDPEDPEVGCNPLFEEDITCLGLDFECLTDPCGDPITTLKDLLQALITQACA